MAKHIAVILTLLLALTGCNHSRDRRLEHLYALTESAPQAALEGLDSLNRDAFGPDDRLFYDLVALKAADKLYIRHTSDSIILPIVARFGTDPTYGPEVLYYAARVYSDLGDYPTASDYFHRAYTASASNPDTEIRAKIASQAGRLNETLHNYSNAEQYVQESIRLDSILDDTLNLMYDLQLLGRIYMGMDRLDSAECELLKSRGLAENFSQVERAEIDLSLGRIAIRKEDFPKALNLVRGLSGVVDSQYYNLALLYETQAYLGAGQIDSAYTCATRLINSKYAPNKHLAYKELLNSKLNSLLPVDSLATYVTGYHKSVDRYLGHIDAQSVATQNSMYNYNLHDARRIKAESQLDAYQWALIAIIIIIGPIAGWMVYKQNGYKKRICGLRNLNAEYEVLIHDIEQHRMQPNVKSATPLSDAASDEKPMPFPESAPVSHPAAASEETLGCQESSDPDVTCTIDNVQTERDEETLLREQLIQNLIKLSKQGVRKEVPVAITSSKIYKAFENKVSAKSSVNEDNNLWRQLFALVDKNYKDFPKKLQLLFPRKLKSDELNIIYLTKCGFSVTSIAVLLGRQRNSISSRRGVLNKLIGGSEWGVELFDVIISLL